MGSTVIERSTDRYCGRLVALYGNGEIFKRYDRNNPAKNNVLSGTTFISFPAMPDDIQLDRKSEYFSHTNQVMPDGLHQYLRTQPMELRLVFKLHYADIEYCVDGPLTLLDIAARLHAFVLPINPKGNALALASKAGQQFTADFQATEARTIDEPKTGITQATGAKNVLAPVTCQLELMYTGEGKPGIVCRGYVREVSVKFQGPWLRGEGNIFNLPTSAEYGFTFVHRPAHTNFYDTQAKNQVFTQPQAFAGDVLNKFYFTRDLVQLASYQGIEDPVDPSAVQPTQNNASTSAPMPGIESSLKFGTPPALPTPEDLNKGGTPPAAVPVFTSRDT